MHKNKIILIGFLGTIFFLSAVSAYAEGTMRERWIAKHKKAIDAAWLKKRQANQDKLLAKSGDKEHFLIQDRSIRRRYVVHVPKGHDGKSALPVVLVLHGGIGTPEGTAVQSRMSDVADKNNFFAVYPQGLGIYPVWNGGYCCDYEKGKHVNDVGFIKILISDLSRNYSIDTKRVYSTGISNGAIMSYRLADELSDKIAAIGPIAGDMDVDLPSPPRPVPIIHFHGVKDSNLPYEGGVGPTGLFKGAHPGVPQTLDRWIKANNCLPKPVQTEKTKDYEMIRYEPAPGQKGAPIVIYKLFEGGHTWPGGVDVSKKLGTGTMVQNVDASAMMWEFFKHYKIEN